MNRKTNSAIVEGLPNNLASFALILYFVIKRDVVFVDHRFWELLSEKVTMPLSETKRVHEQIDGIDGQFLKPSLKSS